MNRQHRQYLVDALGNQLVNPFAQVSRFGSRPSATRTIHKETDLPPNWRASPTPSETNLRATPTMSQRPRQVSEDDDEMTGVFVANALRAAANDPPGETTTAMTVAGGTSNGIVRETPITRQISNFGLEDTHTAVLTQTSYVTIAFTNTTNQTEHLEVRLNTPVDWFVGPSITAPTAGSALANGLYNAVFPAQAVSLNTPLSWPAILRNFPTNHPNSGERPQWRQWFEKLYQYYVVLGLEYEITMYNPSTNANHDAVCAYYFDQFSAQNATSVHPNSATIAQMEQWPDANFVRIPSNGDGDMSKAYRVIKGYHKPGRIRHNVENDEDVRTWTKVGANPSLTEIMTLKFSKAWDNGYPSAQPIMIRMDMRWIVQYKDLNPVFRWPSSQTPGPTTTLIAPSDINFFN